MQMSYDKERACYQFVDGIGAYEYYPISQTFLYRTKGRAIALNLDTVEKAAKMCRKIREAYE